MITVVVVVHLMANLVLEAIAFFFHLTTTFHLILIVFATVASELIDKPYQSRSVVALIVVIHRDLTRQPPSRS
jgi:hypothetical protein